MTCEDKGTTVSGVSGANIDGNLLKSTGVDVDRKILQDLQRTSIHSYSADGVITRLDGVSMTLDNGTQIIMPVPQKKGARIVKTDDNCYDFEKLNDALINDSENRDWYDFMGCRLTSVYSLDDNKDRFNFGHHADGTKQAYNDVNNLGSGCDRVFNVQTYLTSDLNEGDYLTMYGSDNNMQQHHTDKNGRNVETSVDEQGNKKAKTYSHDGKLLKDSYVNATERKLSDGYTIKTSPDGKEVWYYDPKGKNISFKEFVEAEHPYKVKIKGK